MPERELKDLAEKLWQLRQQLGRESAALQKTYERLADLEERCMVLAARIETALQAQRAAQEAPGPAEPPATPVTPGLERIRELREEVEKEKAAQEVVAEKAPAEEGPRAEAVAAAAPAPPEEAKPEPAAVAARQAVPTERAAERLDLEAAIGSYWFSRLGAISLLVGFIIFAGWVQQYMTPPIRVALCYVGAAILCGIGFWFERKYPKFSRPVLAAGLVLAFFTSFASHFVPPMRCLSQLTSTVLMLAGGILVVAVAAGLRSQPLSVLALGMGFWTAVFATELASAFTPTLLLFLCVMGVLLFIAYFWAALMALTVVGVYACDVWWGFSGTLDWPEAPRFWMRLSFLTLYFGTFLAGDMLNRMEMASKALPAATIAELSRTAAKYVRRFGNPIAYFLLGTLVFLGAPLYWDKIHYFYWPLGVVLAALAILYRRVEREPARDDDVLYVMASGLITLGFVSALSMMRLSNVLALEGLCLYVIRRTTGRSVFSYLSIIHYVIGFLHFNLTSLAGVALTQVTDWKVFLGGLPVVVFTLAPLALMRRWGGRAGEIGKEASGTAWSRFTGIAQIDEQQMSHARACFGSVLLLRLLAETVRPDPTFGLWIALAASAAAVAFWQGQKLAALWTLAATFLVWAHGYFFFLFEPIRKGDPHWLFPAAIALTTLVFGAGVFLEYRKRDMIYGTAEAGPARNEWTLLTILSVCVCVLDITVLLEARAQQPHVYALGSALGVIFMVMAVYSRMAFPCLTGLFLIGATSVLLLWDIVPLVTGRATPYNKDIFLGRLVFWLPVGVALTVGFERCFRAWAAALLGSAYTRLERAPVGLVALMTLLLLGLVHVTPWIGRQYETVGFTTVAFLLLGLGLALRSATYRRFGLGVFLAALVRVYLIDLSKLETVYKIIAFLALGAVLVLVSYLYTRFREQFQKWV